uniref:Uncharacterized protein n=1 Tax=Candidatus Kentrum sp. DK TaxID=2126562 RepID=A0A450S5L2_9GAMM|nr:MAG: hypothetical protein BECKDK2373C_GA0170839_101734 [Candidatus Kentron sp. DK]
MALTAFLSTATRKTSMGLTLAEVTPPRATSSMKRIRLSASSPTIRKCSLSRSIFSSRGRIFRMMAKRSSPFITLIFSCALRRMFMVIARVLLPGRDG